MSTLSSLWASTSTKPFVVQDSNGNIALVTQQINNNKFLASLLAANSIGYSVNPTQVVLDGTEAIWSIL